MAKVEKTYEAVCDFLARDQFLDCCSHELYLYLKPKTFKALGELAHEADLFADARGGVPGCVAKGHRETKIQVPHNYGNQVDRKSNISCKICGKAHQTHNCWHKSKRVSAGTEIASSAEFNSPNQGGNWQNRGRNWNRGRNNYRRNQTAPGRNSNRNYNNDKVDHQVNFCKVKGEQSTDKGMHSVYHAKMHDPIENYKENPHKDSKGTCYFLRSRLPTAVGTVNGKEVRVLRDTGCTGVVVRRDLVSDEQMLGKELDVTLINESKLKYPVARIRVECPFFNGTTEALCMEDTLYDLVIGNIDGSKLPDMSHFAASVVTRSQAKKDERTYKKLKVPDQIINSDRNAIELDQASDPKLSNIRKRVELGNVTVSRGIHRGETKFIMKKGLIYRQFTLRGKTTSQLVVPSSLTDRVMTLAHESLMAGHLGIRKTIDRVVAELFWPGVCGDVTRFCKSCDICQRTVQKGRVAKVPLGRLPLIDTPFKRVAVDIVGPIEPRSNNRSRYILTMMDYATRYPEAIALPSIETERVAEALVEMFSRVGVPDEMLTDCGSQFTSEIMKEVARLLSLQQLTTTAFHAQCNGLVERSHATLKQMLRRMCAERPKDWDRYLPALLFAVREVPQESLGFSPFELLYGRNVRGPMAILRELWTDEVEDEEVRSTYDYVINLRNRLEHTCELAMKNLQKVQGKQKVYYDRRAKPRSFKVGDKVLLLLPTDSNKLLLQWRGPFEIVEVLNRVDYRVNVNGYIHTYHANILRLYVERKTEASHCLLSAEASMPLSEDDDDESDEYSLEDCTFPSNKEIETYRDVSISDELTDEQKKEVKELLAKYPDVLTSIPGKTELLEHDIKLSTAEPVRSKGYPLPYKTREIMESEIDEMIELGVIEPSISPYSSPIVLVPKKDGSVRFCIDFRKLNKVTEFDAEPMPNMEEVINRMSGHRFYSQMDLCKGYWQLGLSKRSRPYTAFETPRGLFQFKTMPFGLVNAGASFCRLIRIVLQGLRNVDSFVDDMWIFTETWEKHLKSIKATLDRLRAAKLTAKPSKCKIGYSEIECLGHNIQDQTLRPKDDKIQAVKDAQRPVTKKQVRGFLGLAGFYRKFIPNFSEIAAPLTDLTKKDRPNRIKDWLSHHERAFQTLKSRLTSSPILRLPVFNEGKPFILRSDASDIGIGAVLLQEFEGEGKLPIAYASKKLLPRERNYSVIEKECLAIIWAIEKFRKYLFGEEFILECDHKPLSFMQTAKALNPRIMRWALKLQPYRFRIVAIRGQDNVGADYLSR